MKRYLTSFLILFFALNAFASSELIDYCTGKPQQPEAERDCAIHAPESGPSQEIAALEREIQKIRFMEILRKRMIHLAESSKAEAQLIQYCFKGAGESVLLSSFSKYSPALKTAMDQQCEHLREEVRAEASLLGKFRQHMALRAPRFLTDSPRVQRTVEEKITREISHKYRPNGAKDWIDEKVFGQEVDHFELAPLSAEEVAIATETYDAWVKGAEREADQKKITLLRENWIRSRIDAEREAQSKAYIQMLAEHPLLNHFENPPAKTPEGLDASIIKATRRIEKHADKILKEMEKLDGKGVDSELLDLFVIEGVVRDVARANPELCHAANELRSQRENRAIRQELWLAAKTIGSGAVCTVFLRVPYACFAVAGTGGAAVNWYHQASSHRYLIDSFRAAISKDQELTKALAELDSAEGEMLLATVFIFAPYEMGFGKIWLQIEKNPGAKAALDALSVKLRSTSHQTAQRFYRAVGNWLRQHQTLD